MHNPGWTTIELGKLGPWILFSALFVEAAFISLIVRSIR